MDIAGFYRHLLVAVLIYEHQKNLKLKSIYRIDRDRSESELQEKCNKIIEDQKLPNFRLRTVVPGIKS
jgi:hypothetical protein